ncbi:MAG: tRNA (adenosine(37)-N6)-threonylcarbamoyltransferase complex ATPase subunit type 1 TsaE [Microthrixaceae bacterium]|nr:tRNA (adenosine(37)-N6)-threonylcarbamoyltransferase complex ATPase subunit type 1 TsaE [Microthrixaceae bacterium]
MTGSLAALEGSHEIATSDAMHEFGVRVGGMLRAGDLLVLTGPLGAGKTTFTRGIGEGLRVRGPVQSPTFVIARTHPSLAGGPPLVHVDAYRLGSGLELDDLDIDAERSVVVVEWGRGIAESLAERWWDIEIERPTGARADAGDGHPHDVSEERDEPRRLTIRRGHGVGGLGSLEP